MGGRSRSDTASGGTVVFDDIDPGEYSLTTTSNRRYQELEHRVTVDAGDEIVRRVRFERTDPIHGIVLDANGDQVVPGTTVSIPELTLATRTDDSGRFTFDEQLPDGSYGFEIRVEDDGSGTLETTGSETIVRTEEVGLDRSVSLSVPFETTPGDDDTAELVSEENLFVSLLVRNLERTDLALPARVTVVQQYGTAKGAVSALRDFVDSIQALLDMDLSEIVDAVRELIVLIVDDPTAIKRLAVMLIEDFREKQQADNPFDVGSANYRAFQAGWIPAYVAVIIAVEVLITRGVGRGVSVASDATQIRNSVRTLHTQLRESDRIAETVAAVNRVRSGSSDPDRVVPEAGSVTIPASATYTRLVETVMKARFRFDQDDSQVPDIALSNVGRTQGRVAEMDFGATLLGSERYRSGVRLVTDATGKVQRLAAGDTLIVHSATPRWRDDVELDHVAVTRNADGDLEIDGVWEVTGGRHSAGEKRDELDTALDNIKSDLDSGAVGPDDTISGIPARLFRDVDDGDTATVGPRDMNGFDEPLAYHRGAYRNTAEHLSDHRDFYELE